MDQTEQATVSPSTGVTWLWKTCPDCGARFYGPKPDVPSHQCEDDEDDD